jgi:hypothetical protein
MSKTIKLTNGLEVTVDDKDFEWLNKWNWRAEIKVNYKKISLGRHPSLKEAVKARYLGEKLYVI